MVDKGAVERLRTVASTPFERCTYTRAIELLEEAVKGGKKFEFLVSILSPVDWWCPMLQPPASFWNRDLARVWRWWLEDLRCM